MQGSSHLTIILCSSVIKIVIRQKQKVNRKNNNNISHFVCGIAYPTSTRRHGNFAGIHTLLRILLSSNSAVLINIITGVSPPHFDFVVYYVLCQC
jgi:hypothetical protein